MVQRKRTTDLIKGLENVNHEERLKQSCNHGVEKAQRYLITLFQYLKGGYKEYQGSLFRKRHTEKMKRGNCVLATKKKRFYFDVRENFFLQ